ncbi:O-antigen ligase [Sphingomonas endophytica]|uniref:O-antigen ligase n=1 Tax=Sphingomonas endophytica TaxID=869719 RepID=A0A7X0MNF5_9SPHN|nr:O-antigen ligase family protein [Sphingomonas endophytica]MBB6505294.1 O-antigen ligase [Sphingomonas endophytica]
MTQAATINATMTRWTLCDWLGVGLGIVMPVLAALLYPTYIHRVDPGWAEWTRLLEMPFVVAELVAIQIAVRRGYRDAALWRALPRDVKAAFGLLAIGLTVSSVFRSQHPFDSILLSLITLVHLRFCAAIHFLARGERVTDIGALFRWLTLGLGALAVLTVWRFQLPPPAAEVPGGVIEWGSALPGFISVRHFGSWTGAIAAGLMLALLYGEEEEQRIATPAYLLAAGLTCWSGTRAALLAMVVVGVVALVSLRRWPSRARLVRVAALSVLALALALLLLPDDPVFFLYAAGDAQSADMATGGRLALWHATFERWRDAPLFGWGSGSVFWEVYVGWTHTQPHNVVLQCLISWGVVGAAGALWLLGRAIVATHRTGIDDVRLLPVTGMLYSLLFMSLLEGMLHYPRFIMMIAVGFALLFAARERSMAR